MFADDLTIYAAVNNKSDRKTLQFELNLLCEWCDNWGLTIILMNVNCYILAMVIYIFYINSALLI